MQACVSISRSRPRSQPRATTHLLCASWRRTCAWPARARGRQRPGCSCGSTVPKLDSCRHCWLLERHKTEVGDRRRDSQRWRSGSSARNVLPAKAETVFIAQVLRRATDGRNCAYECMSYEYLSPLGQRHAHGGRRRRLPWHQPSPRDPHRRTCRHLAPRRPALSRAAWPRRHGG